MCNAFVFYLKKQDIFSKRSVDFDLISVIHSYLYIHIALCYLEFCLQDSCNILAMQHSVLRKLASLI